jgi:hypothetical protein
LTSSVHQTSHFNAAHLNNSEIPKYLPHYAPEAGKPVLAKMGIVAG